VSATGARNAPFSIIGGDVVIKGDVEATVDLHVDGRIEGDIRCAALVQGPDSRIKGQVKAKSARIGGVVEGGIAAEELIVEASARIVGDVSYETISIAPGGQVEGRFSHISGAAQAGDLKLVKSDAG
jgi:cytoskeletal protein CcmA (bactofilin family)